MKEKKVMYQLTDSFYCAVPEQSCCTCAHCSDVFWDYTNGIYMLICELQNDSNGDWCESYQWDEEVRPDADDSRFRPAKRERMVS